MHDFSSRGYPDNCVSQAQTAQGNCCNYLLQQHDTGAVLCHQAGQRHLDAASHDRPACSIGLLLRVVHPICSGVASHQSQHTIYALARHSPAVGHASLSLATLNLSSHTERRACRAANVGAGSWRGNEFLISKHSTTCCWWTML